MGIIMLIAVLILTKIENIAISFEKNIISLSKNITITAKNILKYSSRTVFCFCFFVCV